MRVVSRLIALGGLGIAMALPSGASASQVVATRLFFDGAREIHGEGGFTSMSNVSFGSAGDHGPNVGTATLTCALVGDSQARCDGVIVIYARGTTDVSESAWFTDELVGPGQSVFALSGASGAWEAARAGLLRVHPVGDAAEDVELDPAS
jgi:hypothetical protein